MKIRGEVFIGDDVYIENEYPEFVTIENGAQVGLRSTIIAHTRGVGHVVIQQNVFIGCNVVIIAPHGETLTIGEGAVVSAGAIISASVRPKTLVGPERVRTYAHVTVPLTMDTSLAEFRAGLRPLESPRPTAGIASKGDDPKMR